jgi:hypothetical protein
MCLEKRVFRTPQQAGAFIKRFNKSCHEFGKTAEPQRIYQCPVCGQYHTTRRLVPMVPDTNPQASSQEPT